MAMKNKYKDFYAKGGGIVSTLKDLKEKSTGFFPNIEPNDENSYYLWLTPNSKKVSFVIERRSVYSDVGSGFYVYDKDYNYLGSANSISGFNDVKPIRITKKDLEKVKYAKGGGVGDIPSGVFYAKIRPLREGQEPLFVRVSPDSVGEFTAGYVVYHPSGSNKKVAYFRKGDFKNLIEQGDYSIINKSEIPSKYFDGGSTGSSFVYEIGGL